MHRENTFSKTSVKNVRTSLIDDEQECTISFAQEARAGAAEPLHF
jgi:hypothetical protein